MSKSVKKTPGIAISGYYGFGNCGDEAVLCAIVHCLKALTPETEIVVFSNDPDNTRKEYALGAVNRWQPFSIARSLLSCRLLISGGGSLIQDVTSARSAGYYLGVIRLALLLRKKVVIFSQGIGPLSVMKNRVMTRKVIDRCNYITVRDDRSAALLKELGVTKDVHVTGDPVMALGSADIDTDGTDGLLRESGISRGDDGKRRPLLMVSVRRWKDDNHIAPVAELLDNQIRLGWDVLLVPAYFSEDDKAAAMISALMAETPYHIGKGLTARQFIALTARADRVFSMRLHGLICAMAMGTPLVGLSYDPKVDGFMEQAGLERFCLPFDDFDAETAGALLEESESQLNEIKQDQDARRSEMFAAVWDTARKTVELLKNNC